MERHFETKIEELKRILVLMGAYVEKALEEAAESLLKEDRNRFQIVHEIEDKINSEQLHIDNFCMELLAKQGPVAKDLRFIVAVIKINTDLERMGDQCVNIAYNGLDYLQHGYKIDCPEINEMVADVKAMVKQSLDAFVKNDEKLAQKVMLMDDSVDKNKNAVFRRLEEWMMKNPQHIRPALNLILIARNLERLGDHATNIAEDVIFASSGRDIRHGRESRT
ncbi:MAG: phosphate transport system regulatory protein PhoU [Pseudomonadota bacterium]|jgi:phosphate transport system protein